MQIGSEFPERGSVLAQVGLAFGRGGHREVGGRLLVGFGKIGGQLAPQRRTRTDLGVEPDAALEESCAGFDLQRVESGQLRIVQPQAGEPERTRRRGPETVGEVFPRRFVCSLEVLREERESFFPSDFSGHRAVDPVIWEEGRLARAKGRKWIRS